MTSTAQAKKIDAYDMLSARLAQAKGLLAAINTIYSQQEDGCRHILDAGLLRDALGGIAELLEQADNAAVPALDPGFRFPEK